MIINTIGQLKELIYELPNNFWIDVDLHEITNDIGYQCDLEFDKTDKSCSTVYFNVYKK